LPALGGLPSGARPRCTNVAGRRGALAAADQALRLIQANYRAGLATYLDVLNAVAQYHQANIAEIQSVAVRYQDTVALFAALGGGWWNVDRSGAAPATRNP
jgi:outer membrane protein TolC